MNTSLLRSVMAGLLLALAGATFATGNVTLTYRGGGEGKVVFDGQLHAAKGYRCNDCHTDFQARGEQKGALFTTPLFNTHKSALITMETHGNSTQCFACHDGATAPNQCESCHRKVTGF